MVKLTYGLTVMLIGLVTVFIGLIALILIIRLISRIMNRKQTKEEAAAPVPEPVVEKVVEEEETEDANLPYVIAAAIAACEDNSKKFVVRSVRRIGNGWATNGRREQITTY